MTNTFSKIGPENGAEAAGEFGGPAVPKIATRKNEMAILDRCSSSDTMNRMARKKPERLSDQLRDAIDASGKTRYQIAKESGVDQASLSRFMAGKTGLLQDSIDRVAEVIGAKLILEKKPTKKRKKGG